MASVGDYDLDHQIGAGASGTVWRAHHRGPVTRTVALKRLRAGGGADDLARLRREATVLAELDHPHDVRVLEVIHDGDGVAVAMQFAPGGSLDDLLAERGRLEPGQVVALAAPLAEALASAHRRGVVHGDVKPANVLFTSDGEPLLGDFGVARTLGQVTSDQVTGTAEYLAPELLDGARPDQRTDIYALGVVCYQALAGRPPFTGPAPLAVARAAEAGAHTPLDEVPGVPAAMARVVERAMDRDRDRRFATADELARALRTTVPAGEARLPGPVTAGRAAGQAAGAGADPAATRLTRTFGPRPPRPQLAAPRRRWPRRPLALAGVGLVAAGLLYVVRDPGETAPAGGDGCPPSEAPAPAPGARVVSGDVAGDGCTVHGVYAPRAVADGRTVMVLTITIDGADKQIGLGGEGDEILLGDWDRDGVDTPGLYRRAAGVVQYFVVLWMNAGGREPVLALRNDVAAGQTIEADDLVVVRVSSDGGISPIPSSRRDQVIGQPAATSLLAGTLLVPEAVGTSHGLEQGTAVIAIPVPTSRMPTSDLRTGDQVVIARTQSSGQGEGGSPRTIGEGRVFEVHETDDAGSDVRVSVTVHQSLTLDIASAVAAGEIYVYMTAGG